MTKITKSIMFLGSVTLILLATAGCRTFGVRGNKATLILGAYTTPREAYSKSIIPEFRKYWKEKTGQEVEVQESYQASGAQSRAIIAGFEADVAALSLAGDIDRIVQAGLITHDWQDHRRRGIVSTSVVVIAVRLGNPKNIQDWNDLTQPGLNVLTPDPKTSGGAQWNIAAIYGAALRGYADAQKDNQTSARDFLKRVLSNVSIMDKGARESITNFERGVGDAAVTYENEVLVGRQAGRQYDYVIPRSTLLIENPVALVDKYADKHGMREVAEAFINFLGEKQAQQAYAAYGLRPVEGEMAQEVAAKFPPVQDLWKIDYLGGWERVFTDVFSPTGAYTKAFEELHGG